MNIVLISVIALATLGLGLFSWKKPRLASIVIWSLITTTLLISLTLIVLPVTFAEKAIWLSLLVPIILVGFQYWCYWAENEKRVLFTLITLSLLSGGAIVFIDPII